MSSRSPADSRPLTVPPLHALFQRRVDGDDALLRLARLRFEQAGLAAEVYADTLSSSTGSSASPRRTRAGRSST
jgi:hypothetical protein